jgi:hypothetical protein
MDNEQKEKLSKKYIKGLYGIWRPIEKKSKSDRKLFSGPRKSFYLFGSFQVKAPGINPPYQMTNEEFDFFLRNKAYDRACRISEIYRDNPWEEPETLKVFFIEAKNQWAFVCSNNASLLTRLYFLATLILKLGFVFLLLVAGVFGLLIVLSCLLKSCLDCGFFR